MGEFGVERLLNALLLSVPADQGIEDGKDVAPVFDHAIENVAKFRIALGVAVPLQEDRRRNFDIAAELLWRMAAQEEPIEKRSFTLRERRSLWRLLRERFVRSRP